MIHYPVTKMVSKLGYIGGIIFIILSALLGYSISKLFGLAVGLVGGTMIVIPILVICEMAIAIVAIEQNTRSKN